MRRCICTLLWICAASIVALGQATDAPVQKRPDASGVITGRVLDDSGQPVFNADVQANEAGGNFEFGATVGTAATDEDGSFRVEGLGPHAYTLSVTAAGYVEEPRGPASRGFHYVGDVVTLKIRKGGVITGKVARADGEPVIAVAVTVTMVRDADGRRASDWDRSESTDDRGIYRVYGLPDGTYIVNAGGESQFWYQRRASFTTDDAPTYYPSATLEQAGEVAVRSGQEVTGIDISYRGERGHKASGVVVGAETKSASVMVRRLSPSVEVGSAQTERTTGTFEVNALADGEYEVVATLYGDREYESSAPAVKFKVRGGDVTGLRLVLAPVSSIAGMVVLTGLPAADAESPCPGKSSRTVTEVVVSISRDAALPGRGANSTSADNTGSFTAKGLEAARYRVSPRLPDDGWYVQSILRTEPGRKTPVDVKRDGLSVSAGQEVEGVTITIAAGAARVSGRVTPDKEGASLPDVVRVHLIPAEPDAGEAAARFYEIEAERDGTFEIKNVAPGAYRAIAMADTTSKDDAAPHRPASWDQAGRVALRKAAAGLPEISLAPCAALKDVALRLGVSAPPRAAQ